MKLKDMRTLPDDEIGAEIDKARAKIFKMRFQAKGENMENPGSLRTLRRDVARLLTVLKERQKKSAGEAPVAAAPARGGEA